MVIKTEPNKKYIIYNMKNSTDSFALHMLLENDIKHLISCQRKTFNGEEFLQYDIWGKMPLSEYPNKLKVKEMTSLLQSIYQLAETLEEYCLSIDAISFEPNTIFEQNGEWYFCYFPEKEKENTVTLLGQMLLSNVDATDEIASVLAYQFYMGISQTPDAIKQVIGKTVNKENETYVEEKNGMETVDEMEKEEREEERENQEIIIEDTEKKEIDKLTLVIFLGVCICGFFASMWTINMDNVQTLLEFMYNPKGLLGVCFFIGGIMGITVQFFLAKKRGRKVILPQDIEEEDAFTIPPIDKF